MTPAPGHPRELERLAELQALLAPGTAREPEFEAMAMLARRLAGYEVAAISLVDADRQWPSACDGAFAAPGAARAEAFCGWTILGTGPFVVPDAAADTRFADNPLVAGPPRLRAYCGLPLATEDGLAVGTLSLLDRAPRTPTPDQLARLGELARAVTAMLRGRARSEAIAVLGHEVRNTLQGIVGMAGVLAATPGLPPKVATRLGMLDQAAGQLTRLVGDSLDYARLEAGAVTLERAPFDPAGELDATLDLLRAQAEEGRVALSASIGPDVPARVLGDAGRLRQLLLNLVGNAVAFSAGGTVTVALDAAPNVTTGPRLRFALHDSAIGMTPAEAARLFERVGQADASTARRFGGPGLGLVIARRLVALMGGRIEVESRAGQGSTFRFDIAVAPAEEAPAPAARVAGPRRVLVAEDTPAVRLLTASLLRAMGHAVEVAADGEEAVAAAAAGGFDLVLMDLEMPRLDGLGATRRIRALPGPAGRVRIMGLTGEDSAATEAVCREAGMDGVLHKPLQATRIAALL